MVRRNVEATPVNVEVVLENAVLGVGEDDEDDRQPVARRGPQRLDAVHRRAVAREAHQRPVRDCELHAERARDPLADPAAAAAEIVAGAAEAEGLGDLRAAGDRLLDDDHVLRYRRRQRLQHDGHRHGPALTDGVEAGTAVPLFRLAKRDESPVSLLRFVGVGGGALLPHQRGDRLQRGLEPGDQARGEPVVAGEALRRLLDLEHRRTGRERSFRRVPDLLEEGAAHHEHQVGGAEGLCDVGGVGRDAAPVVGVHVGDRLVLMDELGPDAGAHGLGQGNESLAGTGARHVVADHYGRLLGGQQMPGDGGHALRVRRRRAVECTGGQGLNFGLLLHHVDGQRDEDGAGRRIVGDLEGAPHDRRDLVGALGLNAPLHHRRRHGHQVVAEDRVAQAKPRVLLPGRDHHRRVGPERAEDHADGVAEARRDVQVHHPRTAARLGVVARGSDGDDLVQREHVVDRRVAGEAVDQRALGGAGVAEQMLDPVGQQALHEYVAPVHVLHPSLRGRVAAGRGEGLG